MGENEAEEKTFRVHKTQAVAIGTDEYEKNMYNKVRKWRETD